MEYSIRKYDEQGNMIYREAPDGFWHKSQYDEQGKKIYYEDSDGVTRGTKQADGERV